MIKILYLYTEIMGYQMPVLSELVNHYGAAIHVVHWDVKKNTPYIPPEIAGVKFYARSSFDQKALTQFVRLIEPDLVYISGWQDSIYLKIAAILRSQGVPVVAGFDDQWRGSLRQSIGAFALRAHFRKKYFSHAWVAGPYQYEYARRLGFSKRQIRFALLSCDANLFSGGVQRLENKAVNYPKRFLYAGNFRLVKGTDILLQAYRIYRRHFDGNWQLTCVGNGPLRDLFTDYPEVEVREFATQEELLNLAGDSGAFILPSRFDQWGVVVHEFALAGLPLILSEYVGSHPVFLIQGHNGYLYENNSPERLAERMNLISLKSDESLLSMAHKSHELGKSITPEICAANLFSCAKDYHFINTSDE